MKAENWCSSLREIGFNRQNIGNNTSLHRSSLDNTMSGTIFNMKNV